MDITALAEQTSLLPHVTSGDPLLISAIAAAETHSCPEGGWEEGRMNTLRDNPQPMRDEAPALQSLI